MDVVWCGLLMDDYGHPGHLIMTLRLRFSRICSSLVDFLLHGHRTLTAFHNVLLVHLPRRDGWQ